MMKMVLIASCVVVAAMTICLLGRTALRRLCYPLNYFRDAAKFGDFGERSLEVVNLGATPAKFAFDWVDSGVAGGNFAMAPQCATYDFAVLKKYEHCLKPNAVVLMPLFPFSMICSSTYPAGRIQYFAKYYALLNSDEMMSYSLVERFRTWITLRVCHRNWQVVLRNDPVLTVDRPVAENLLDSCVDGHRRAWMRFFDLADFSAPVPAAHQKSVDWNVKVYQDMIAWCRKQGYKPVFIFPPIAANFDFVLTQQFYENYVYDFIKRIARPDILFYDYIKDAQLRDIDYFTDGLTLNARGRRIFTRAVIDRLQADGLLDGEVKYEE